MNELIIGDKYFDLILDSRFPLEIPEDGWQHCSETKVFTRPKGQLFIYLIKVNDSHLYVGSDKKGARITDHISALKRRDHKNGYMQNLFNKYSLSSFYFRPLFSIPLEYCQYRDQIENSYIKLFNTFHFKNNYGLNLAEFANTPLKNHPVSLKTRQKISLARKGKPLSEEHKRKLSASGKLRPSPSQETRDKISKASKGRKHSQRVNTLLSEINIGNKNALGTVRSNETKEKIAAANRGRKDSEERRKKISDAHKGKKWTEERKLNHNRFCKTYTLINPAGEIQIITNMKKYCEKNNLCQVSMRLVARGKYKQYLGWTTQNKRNEM